MKKLLVVPLALAFACLQVAGAIPDPFACGPRGSTSTGGTHNYDGFVIQTVTLPFVYDQCLQHHFDDLLSAGMVVNYDEFASGIGGAAYAAVTSNNPYGDARYGGVSNCWAPLFTGHHGSDNTINTADAVHGGNIFVFVVADQYDAVGEAILAASGFDVRDPCGDGLIGAFDFFDVSPPCGPTIGPPNCAVNTYTFDSGTLATHAGLDGGVWTMYGVVTGSASVPTTGHSWTS